MKILITGANGFLGKMMVQELKHKNQLSGLSRESDDYKVTLQKQIPNFTDSFDLVIHAAGKAHSIPKTAEEKEEFYQVNVGGTENLLRGLEKSGFPKQFVFISSVSVYGQVRGIDIKETAPLNAKDPYGLSKIKAESIIREWCERNSIICTILRLPLLVGVNAPGNLGAMVKAIEKGYYFDIDGGKARKSMVLGYDVASSITDISAIGGIYNLTDGFHPAFRELSIAISRKKNKPLNLPIYLVKFLGKIGDFFGEKAPINSLKIKKITSDLTFDDSKARASFSWNPQSVVTYLQNSKI